MFHHQKTHGWKYNCLDAVPKPQQASESLSDSTSQHSRLWKFILYHEESQNRTKKSHENLQIRRTNENLDWKTTLKWVWLWYGTEQLVQTTKLIEESRCKIFFVSAWLLLFFLIMIWTMVGPPVVFITYTTVCSVVMVYGCYTCHIPQASCIRGYKSSSCVNCHPQL